MSLLCRPSGWVHSHQSCSFPCVGQNRFLATGVNSCTLMGKALRKCTTKRNYSKQVWKHSSVVTGRGGDSGALVFTTYVHSSALTITLYLHLWATFTCACVCAYVLPCACVTWRPSALATASGFDLQSDTYRRNTNKQTNDGPDFTSQLEHFHKIGRKKGKRGHIWIWSTDTKVTSPSKIPQIEKRIFKVAVLFMSSGEMSARCGFLGLLLARVRARGGWNGRTDRQTEEERRQKERVWGREVCHARQTTQRDSDLFGNCSMVVRCTRGRLHQRPTSDPLRLLKRTQLSLLYLQADGRDELLSGVEHAHKDAHAFI